MTHYCPFDDLSSIESSTCRIKRSDLESKNLHLLREIVELKNRMADLHDGFSSNLGQESTKPLTTFSTDDGWPVQHDDSFHPFEQTNEKHGEAKAQTQTPKVAILSPPKLPRRKSMMNLSNLNITSRFRNPNPSGASSKLSTAQSLFTKKITWKDKRPKLIPRNIFFPAELVPVPDEVSDVSA
ncbi:hypothetical protein ACHAWO_001471 [Cyclotella atomus]|uniref:Uncharacterized protein n=1 Tax=Cyclotella atomus TaxID=382360 RepID=A0ABD3PE24_9STRA